MTCIDGFVLAVPTANKAKFKKHAEDAAAVIKECGALKIRECWGDDVPDGEVTSFPIGTRQTPTRRSCPFERKTAKGMCS